MPQKKSSPGPRQVPFAPRRVRAHARLRRVCTRDQKQRPAGGALRPRNLAPKRWFDQLACRSLVA